MRRTADPKSQEPLHPWPELLLGMEPERQPLLLPGRNDIPEHVKAAEPVNQAETL
jgi:hypothetical protein